MALSALGLERVAVGAFHHGRVGFVGAYIDLRKGAVVLRFAVVGALGNGTADALVCVHVFHLTFYDFVFIVCS